MVFGFSRRLLRVLPSLIGSTFLLFTATKAYTASFDISNTVTTTQSLSGSETGIVESTGIISVDGSSVDAIDVSGNSNTLTIVGGGKIYTTGQNGDAIDIDGASNSISNSGLISTNGNGAYGIRVMGGTAGSSNTVTITDEGSLVTAGQGSIGVAIYNYALLTIASGSSIETTGLGAYGVEVGDHVTIANAGEITTTKDSSIGIHVVGRAITVSQTGTITTEGNSAYGVYSEGSVVTGPNKITMQSSDLISTSGSNAYGIELGNNDRLTTQSGAHITTTGLASYGIYGLGSTTIDNAGAISTSNTGSSGIYLAETDTEISQVGTITTEGTSAHGIYAAASTGGSPNTVAMLSGNSITTSGTGSYGVYLGSDNELTIDTGASISTSGSGSHGIYAGDRTSITNDGTITVTANNAAGIYAGSDNTITTSGTISSPTYAIWLAGTGNTVEFDVGMVITGKIRLESSDNAFVFDSGLNATLTVSGQLPDDISGEDYYYCNYVYDVAHGNSGECTLGSVDTTGFALEGEMLSDMTGKVFDVVGDEEEFRGSEAMDVAGAGSVISPVGERLKGRSAVWAKAFGNYRSQSKEGSIAAARHEVGGLVSGVGGWVSPGVQGGGLLGTSSGVLSVENSQSIDWQSWFGGLYGTHSLGGGSRVGVTLLGGVTSYNSSRDVVDNTVSSGISLAKADYTGVFLSPELSLASDFGFVKGRIAARYAALFLDGYEEDGSSADLKVPARTVERAGVSARLAIPRKLTSALTLEPYVGMEGRVSSSPDIDAEVIDFFNEAVTLDGGGERRAMRLKAGSSLDYVSAEGTFSWRATMEGATGTDGATLANATLSAEWTF